MYSEQENGKPDCRSPKIDQIVIVHYNAKRNRKRHTRYSIYYLLFAAELFIEEQEQGSYQIKSQLSWDIPVKSCVPRPISDAGYIIEEVKSTRSVEPQQTI